jgi:hypothetical protein
MSEFPSWLAGALLSAVGSTVSNLGVNVQKFASIKVRARRAAPRPASRAPLTRARGPHGQESEREVYRGYCCQPL